MKTYKFKNLNVWNKSVEFVTFVYEITSGFPKEERFGLVDQIRRASVSITLNIAEGSGAGSDLEFKRFLKMAQRSAFEVIAALEVAINLKMADQASLEEAINKVDELSAMMTGLIKKLTAHS
ncbi:four helix bundle protein [Candidatus Daviesbacteria bacterium]|nr:four helix bundle protein [Candidatus Daviesbacteria bacterium]